jgi:tetratricopeptide (TPR) repeat protein
MSSNRRNRAILFACFFAGVALAGSDPVCGQVSNVAKHSYGAVVTVYEKGLDNRPSIATGFFIDRTHIVTVRHNLARTLEMVYSLPNGPTEPIAGVCGENISGDLVELLIDTMYSDGSKAPLSISSLDAKEGQPIVVIGSPYGREFTVTHGNVSAIRSLPWQDSLLQVTAPVGEGSSGSPILNLSGEVVGVFLTYDSGAEYVAYAIPVSCLRALVPIPFVSIPSFSSTVGDWPDAYHYERGYGSEHEAIEKALDKRIHNVYDSGLTYFAKLWWHPALVCFKVCDSLHHTGATSYMMGQCEYMLGHYDQAIGDYRKSARLILGRSDTEHTVSLLESIGRTYLSLAGSAAELDSSIYYYRQVLRYEPDDGEALVGVGSCYFHLQKDSLAFPYFTHAATAEAHDQYAHYYLGLIEYHRHHLSDAEREIRRAIDTREHAMFYGGLGDVLWDEGRESEAVQSYRTAIDRYRVEQIIEDPDEFKFLLASLSQHHLLEEKMDALAVQNEIENNAVDDER